MFGNVSLILCSFILQNLVITWCATPPWPESLRIWSNVEFCLFYSNLSRGRILGQNPEKTQQFSSSLFTVTSTALPWDLYFFKLMQPLIVSTVQLLYTMKEKGGKPDRIPYTLFPVHKPQVRELSRLCEKILRPWIRLLVNDLKKKFFAVQMFPLIF
jgi:hypothetical protein